MLTVQYTGKRERTVGIDVVYPGELLQATPAMLAAWRAEHGDVFAVAGEAIQAGGAHAGAIVMDGSGAYAFGSIGAIVMDGSAAHAFGSIGEADAAAAQVRTKGRGK